MTKSKINHSTTVGSILKRERIKKGLSLENVHYELKIQIRILKLMESNQFHRMNNEIQIKGFLKNYSKLLNLNYENLIAIYKRDYGDFGKINNSDDLSSKLTQDTKVVSKIDTFHNLFSKIKQIIVRRLKNIKITRRLLYVCASLIGVTIFGIFAFTTARTALSKPYLFIENPIELTADYFGNIEYEENSVRISGKTEENALVFINGELVNLKADSTFESQRIPTLDKETPILIEAESVFGVKSIIRLNMIKPDFEVNELNLRIIGRSGGSDVKVLVDDVKRLDEKIDAGEEKRLEGDFVLEIEANSPSNLIVFLNGEEFELNTKKTEFRNEDNKLVVVKE